MEFTSQLRKVERVLLCVPCLPLPCPRWLTTDSLRRGCSGRGCGARGGDEHVSSHEPVTSTLRHPRVTREAALAA